MEHTTSVSYKKIIHASPFGYASYRRIKSDTGQTVDIEFTDMNPAFSRISGLQPEHVIGKRLSQLLKQPRFRKHDLLGLNNARRLYARQFMEDRWEYYATRQDIRYLAHIYAADSHIMVLMLTPCSDIEIDTSAFSTRRHHMVCRFKPDTTLTFVNKAYCQNVGRAAIKLIGRSFLDLVPRDKHEELRAHLREIARTREPASFTHEVMIDGALHYHEWTDSPLFDINDSLIGFQSIGYDVTAEVTSQKQAELHARQLHSILEAIPNYIFAKGADGRYLMANSKFASVFGQTPESIIGKRDEDLGISSARLSRFAEADARARREGTPVHIPEEYEKREDGSYGWFQTIKLPYQHPGVEGHGVLGVSLDITARKEAENELARQKEQFEIAIQGNNDGIWDWKIGKEEPFYSARWKEQLGYEEHEIPNTLSSFERLLHPEDKQRVKAYIESYIKGEIDLYDIEFRMLHKQGGYRWIHSRGDALRNPDGTPYRMAGSHTDITERKKAEEELLRTKSFLQQTNEVARVGGWEYDMQTRQVSWTDTVFEIHGQPVSSGPLSLEEVMQMYSPESRERLEAAIRQSIEQKTSYDIELEVIMPEGTRRWTRGIGNPVFKNGRCTKLYGTVQDIHEERQNRKELENTRQKLQSIFNNMADVVWSVSLPDYKLLFITPSVEELYGTPLEEWEQNSEMWVDFIHPEDKALGKESFRQLEDKGFYSTSYRIIDRAGAVKWISNRGRYVYDESGAPVRIDGYISDITSSKQAEMEIDRYSQMLELLFDIATNFINIGLDDAGAAIDRALAKIGTFIQSDRVYIFEYDVARQTASNTYEWCAEGIKAFIHEQQNIDLSRIQPVYEQHEKGQLFSAYDTREIQHSGLHELLAEQDIQSLICLPMMQGSHPEGFIGFDSVRDKRIFSSKEQDLLQVFASVLMSVNSRIRLERDLVRARERAEAANRSKSLFLANMSHEIRTPLNGVIGFTELLSDTELNETQNQYVKNAIISAHSLLGIINDILDFSKIEAGKLELELRPTDIETLAAEALDIIKYQAAQSGLELLLYISPAACRSAMVDPVRLKQILVNLLSNAVKFTERGGTVELHIGMQMLAGQRARFSFEVRDTGVGISPENQKKLFKAFSQADNSTTRKFGGTGLGLIISNLLAQKMGGEIGLESREGWGSRFSFSIKTQLTDAPPKTPPPVLKGLQLGLLVHSEGQYRMLQDIAAAAGMSVTRVHTARELAEFTEPAAGPPPLLICEYQGAGQQGVSEGFGLLRRLLSGPAAGRGLNKRILVLYMPLQEVAAQQELNALKLPYKLDMPVTPSALYHLAERIHLADTAAGEVPAKPSRQPIFSKLTRNGPEKLPPADAQQTAALALKAEHPFTILIAEDVRMNLMLISAMLKKLLPGVRLLEAENGREAVKKAAENQIDLILMDIQMPELDGLDATAQIRAEDAQRQRYTPIVALTAGVVKEERERCMQQGMDDYLSKPIEDKQLKRVLREQLLNGENSSKS